MAQRHPIGSVTSAQDEAMRAISQRINGERLILLGWSRAILMQLAHPLVAAGVYHHSGFRSSPVAAIRRLHSTTSAMLAITFGDDDSRERALARVRVIHTRVNGTLDEAVGSFSRGAYYSAEDPDLVLWVHATLIESIVVTYERFIGPLAPEERDLYCAASMPVPVTLGAIPSRVPRTWSDLLRYVDETLTTREITVGPQARALMRALLYGALSWVLFPAAWTNRLITAGLLPPRVRAEYGLRWNERRERTLARVTGAIRLGRKATPDVIRRFR